MLSITAAPSATQPPFHSLRRHRVLLAALASLLFWAIAISLCSFVYPNFTEATVTVAGAAPVTIKWPFIVHALPAGPRICSIPVELGTIHPSSFSLYADCDVTAVEINGTKIARPYPWRNLDDKPIILDFRGHLRSGHNTITLYLESSSRDLSVKLFASPKDPLVLATLVLVLSALALMLLYFQLQSKNPLSTGMAAVLLGGIAIRILYVAGTPYHFWAYDLAGHIEYIKYFASHLALPPPGYGWETHQAPLYYVLCGLWMHLTGQASSSWLYGQWQLFSLLLSIGTFAVCLPMATLLFPSGEQRDSRLLFLGILATFPGIVCVASRISNDAPFTFLSFVWFFLLLQWWKEPTLRNGLFVSLSLGIGILIKNTTFALGAISIFCFIAHPSISIQSKLKSVIICGVVCVAIAGWYQIPRAFGSRNLPLFMVGNCYGISPSEAIPSNPLNLLYFNPVAVVATPFNDPASNVQDRQLFLEFLYKSSLFGEWTMGSYLLLPARILVINGLLCLPLFLIGIYRASTTPTIGTLVGLLLTVAIYVSMVPFACNQDFRFVAVLAVPITYFILSHSSSRRIYNFLPAQFVAMSLIFLTLLSWG